MFVNRVHSSAATRRLLSQRHLQRFNSYTTTAPTSGLILPSNDIGGFNKCLSNHPSHHRRSKSSSAATALPSSNGYESAAAFPSIIIGSCGRIEPQGSFAEAQAEFLSPDPSTVESLTSKLLSAKMGVVAHYYMDVELQGVLQAISALQKSQQQNSSSPPLVTIADSLAMGDQALLMAQKGGVERIACLGVDFMSESVSAILSRNDYGHVPVYRATEKSIGCSLAESAEREGYRAWLQRAVADAPGRGLHVIYINTSLETKAVSAATIPTITCTSSNVLRTLLQAGSQVDGLQVYYGPDTYMGENLVSLLTAIVDRGDGEWSNERIARELHPAHTRSSLARLRDSINVYPNGNCVVHHMFGAEVVETVKRQYSDAFVTAHLEVPGEMFEIAMEKSLEGKGVVGSTSDILKFISSKVREAAAAASGSQCQRLKFILGTEAGMVTSIIQSVNDILAKSGNDSVEAEIIFPVASEAMTPVGDNETDLSIVPGVTGGEGCSTAGGCATCPFMKMNDLDALENVVDMVLDGSDASELTLKGHLPPDRLRGKLLNGLNAIDLGTEPIMFMRHFMKEGCLPDDLMKKIHESGVQK